MLCSSCACFYVPVSTTTLWLLAHPANVLGMPKSWAVTLCICTLFSSPAFLAPAPEANASTSPFVQCQSGEPTQMRAKTCPRGGRLISSGTSPPPLPCPPGPLRCQGSIAAGHTYGGAEGARKHFFIPLANVAPLPAQALERGWEAAPCARGTPPCPG